MAAAKKRRAAWELSQHAWHVPGGDLLNVAPTKRQLALSGLNRVLAQNKLDQRTLAAARVADKTNGRALRRGAQGRRVRNGVVRGKAKRWHASSHLRQVQLNVAEVVRDLLDVPLVGKLDVAELNVQRRLVARRWRRQGVKVGLGRAVVQLERLVARRAGLAHRCHKDGDLGRGEEGFAGG